jgi:hypothetical protein
MTEAEIDELLSRARRSLASHTADARRSVEPGEFRAAMAVTLGVLQEIAEMHPAIRPEIDALVAVYQPQALDG